LKGAVRGWPEAVSPEEKIGEKANLQREEMGGLGYQMDTMRLWGGKKKNERFPRSELSDKAWIAAVKTEARKVL